MILQFIICFFATLSFAVLFSAPKKQLIFCGLTGAIGWIAYLICLNLNVSSGVSNLFATLILTLFARLFAAINKNPVTVYLIAGIFPLVPGAGIYYTSYYFIMNEMSACTKSGMDTIKVAGSFVLGIIFGFALPQSIFNTIGKVERGKKHERKENTGTTE